MVQERLDQAERTFHHVRTIKQLAPTCRGALQLTHAIQQAQRELASLQGQGAQDEATLQEIQRLELLITGYSQQAARSIALRELSDA